MKMVKTEDAIGCVLCHDMTQIIKDVKKDAAFRKGHIVTPEDIPVLLSMGKERIFIWEKKEGFLHEDEAVKYLWDICKNDYLIPTPVKEGKIDIKAGRDGLFMVDEERLFQINRLGEMMLATRQNAFPVKIGEKLAGTRIIPLVIEQEKMEKAKSIAGDKPLLSLIPFQPKKYSVITTGSEVFGGLIKDSFTPVIIEKMEEYGCELLNAQVLGDDNEKVTAAIIQEIEKGAQMVVCTGGMSVDPDDRTPLAIRNTGAEVISYGAPVLPGAMFMLAYYQGNIPIVGLPGCVMYSRRTIFDLILPRIMANLRISHDDLARLGHGGLCLLCDECHYPNCSFGK